MKISIFSFAAMLSVLPATSFASIPPHASQSLKAYDKAVTPLIFRTDADITKSAIPAAPIRWGMDVAWNWDQNVQRGTNFIGQDVLSIGRVSFQPSDLVDANGNLSAAQQRTLQSRLNNMQISGVREINLNCDHEVLMNKENFPNCDQNYANYNGKPVEWYRVIKATKNYCEQRGFRVISVSPFNEPDYTAWKEGTQADFKEICRLITEDPDFNGVRICAGNTLNCDKALSWYNYMKPYVSEGNTHQLAGSFDNYAKFWQTVEKDGNYGTADELHNTMEAFVGIHYGMDAGIWWGYDGECRGEFCKASHYGKEIAYAENRSKWSAAAVYKRPEGRIDAFLGTSERQAYDSSYELISTDRPVYYAGEGPYYNYAVNLPGGTGYQNGQTNAERMVTLTWGEDVPVEPIVDGNYVIMNVSTKQVIGFSGGASSDGTRLILGTYTGTKSQNYQQWHITPVDPRVGGDFGYFFIQSVRNKRQQMDVLNGSLKAGGQVCGYPGGTTALEQWSFEYAGGGDWYIRSRHSGFYLDSTGGLTQQPKNTEGLTQHWRLMPVGAPRELTAPDAPTALAATPQSSSVLLTWKQSASSDAVANQIYRSANGTDWDVIARMVTDTAFLDNSAIAGVEYTYRIKAVDRCRNLSVASEEVKATVSSKPALIARYNFDETTADTCGVNAFDLATAGTVSYKNSSMYKKEGTHALYFNGTNTYGMLPHAAVTQPEMTIATWVYVSNSTAWQRIFDFGNGTDQYIFLTPNGDNQMRFVMKNGGEEQILATAKLSTLKLHHVAVTIGKEDVTLYLDGEAVATTKDITIRPTDIRPVMCYLGRSQFPSDPLFKGYLDDFRIYNCALSADNIARLYNGEEPVLTQKGDANADGQVNVFDVVAVSEYILNGSGDIDLTAADYNGDGNIDVYDVVGISEAILNEGK